MLQKLTFPFKNGDFVTTTLRVSVSIDYRGALLCTIHNTHTGIHTCTSIKHIPCGLNKLRLLIQGRKWLGGSILIRSMAKVLFLFTMRGLFVSIIFVTHRQGGQNCPVVKSAFLGTSTSWGHTASTVCCQHKYNWIEMCIVLYINYLLNEKMLH